jgi:serine/threonine-protein phosphatase 2A regulatory subunit A
MAGLDFDPFEFFTQEIQHDDAPIRLAAVNRISLIASALGPDGTVQNLLPFIKKVVTEEPLCNDEEFLFSMAKQYSVLVEYVGTSFLAQFIEPLEHLAAQEETVIRDQAVTSLCVVIKKQNNLAQTHLVPTLHRLATKSDFTARVSACALLPTAYTYAQEDQKKPLRDAYKAFCADDTPMIRRAAAHKMRDFFSVCEKNDIMTDLMPVYRQLSQEDTQDTIRVACVYSTLVMAKMFNVVENQECTVNVIRDAVEDRSWRVRLTVAKSFDQLCQAFGPEIVDGCLVKWLCLLLKDHEQEVRRRGSSIRISEACLIPLHLAAPTSTFPSATVAVTTATLLLFHLEIGPAVHRGPVVHQSKVISRSCIVRSPLRQRVHRFLRCTSVAELHRF